MDKVQTLENIINSLNNSISLGAFITKLENAGLTEYAEQVKQFKELYGFDSSDPLFLDKLLERGYYTDDKTYCFFEANFEDMYIEDYFYFHSHNDYTYTVDIIHHSVIDEKDKRTECTFTDYAMDLSILTDEEEDLYTVIGIVART